MNTYKCKICNTLFESKYKNAAYCSEECREKAARLREAARVRVRRRRRIANTKSLLKTVGIAASYGLSYGNFVAKRSMGLI